MVDASSLAEHAKLTKSSTALLDALEQKLLSATKLTELISTRASTLSLAERNIGAVAIATNELLLYLDTSTKVEATLKRGPTRELDTFLASLQQLQTATTYFEEHSTMLSCEQAFQHAEFVRKQAMADCLQEFIAQVQQAKQPATGWLQDRALHHLQESLAPASASLNAVSLPEAAQGKASRLAAAMLKARHVACINAYVKLRGAAVDEMCGGPAAVTAISTSALQMQSIEQLERTVAGWALQLRILLVVAVGELQLARSIWASPHDETVFQEIVSRSLHQLIGVGLAITETRRVPEKLFVVLDTHHHFMGVRDHLVTLLSSIKQCEPLVTELLTLGSVLGAAARAAYEDVEEDVRRDGGGKLQVVSGTVHPLCARTMAFLKRLFTHEESSHVLFPAPPCLPAAEAAEEQRSTASEALEGVLGLLLTSLEAKGQTYKNLALSHLFLMNNIHYMVRTLEQSEVLAPFAHEWVAANQPLVQVHADGYHDATWGPIMVLLGKASRKGDPEPSDPTKLKAWVKEKLKGYVLAVEAVRSTQCTWSIVDPGLKESVRQRIKQEVLPAVLRFFRKYGSVEFSTQQAKYLRYSDDVLEGIVDEELFEARPPVSSKER